ncbi:hypothetical protein [Candidatus Sororendozoicomonas aggregata]|uniref:hypothetical protein n=1 Tax=Candidatus Sororendozoicomonas aggregata TaxID=3073239 RepID=UPI002ED4EEC4
MNHIYYLGAIDRTGGKITWDFDQSRLLNNEERGICMGLCAYWIKHHAQGNHLKNKINDDNVINKIKFLQNDEESFDPDMLTLPNQVDSTTRFLARKGIHLLFDPVKKNYIFDSNVFYPNIELYEFSEQAHNMINQFVRFRSCYVLILMHNLGYVEDKLADDYSCSAHVTCLWIGNQQEDACYFDPNHGEVWFDKRDKFIGFARAFFPGLMMRSRWSDWALYPLTVAASSTTR